MKIVVKGGAGRRGQSLIKECANQGHEVLCLDTAQPADRVCSWLPVGLRDTKQLITALEGAVAVVHLARIRFPYTSKGFDPISGLWKPPDGFDDAERFTHNVTTTSDTLAATL